jgi:hypothetical protein
MKNILPTYTFLYDQVRFSVYHANIGEGLIRHEHTFAHLTMCVAGKSAIRKENIYKEIDKDTTPVILKENEWHEVESLVDGTIFINVFSSSKGE